MSSAAGLGVGRPTAVAPDATLGEVRRERLLDVLLGSPARSVCVAAPSGYGKTTLVRQWAQRDGRPFVEVRLSQHILDAAVVAQVLVAQLQRQGMVSDDAALPPVPDSLTWHLKVLPALGEILTGLASEVVVVLDDTTDLAGPAWQALVDCIVHSLPAGSALCVVTRGEVPRALRQQRLHGTELELGADSLAFDLLEVDQLMAAMGLDVSGDQLSQLWEQCQGWPAVVYLAALALGQGQRVITVSLETSTEIRAFMRDNILDRLDASTQDFLMTASVLEELTGPLCTAVTGRDDADAVLRELASTYRLISPVGGSGSRYHVHALLRGFLSDELRARSVVRWQEAHRCASRLLATAGDVDRAVSHALLADDDDEVLARIWPSATMLLASGRAPILRRWLNAAGPDRLERLPELAVAAAWVAQQDGETLTMAQYHALAERTCERQGRDDLHGQVGLIWASMAVNGVEDMARTADEIVPLFSASDPALPTSLYHRGAAHVLLGRAAHGIEDLDAGRRLSEVHGLHVMHAILASELGLAYLETGATEQGIRCVDESRSVLAHHGLDDLVVMAIAYATSAHVYVMEGNAREARQHLQTAVRLVSRLHGPAPWFLVRSTLMLAETALAVGEPRQAHGLLHEAEHHYGRPSACRFNDRLLDRVRRAVGEADDISVSPEPLTLAETRVLQYLPTHLSFPEIADEMYLSRFTVKTQALAAYRKLGVHSRREAVEKARALGLLPHA